MDGWMDGCVDGWMDGWKVGSVRLHLDEYHFENIYVYDGGFKRLPIVMDG